MLFFPGNNIQPHSENVGVLAVMFLSRGVGDQTIIVVPTQFANCVHCSAFSFTIAFDASRVSEGRLQFDAVAKCLDILQRHD